MEDFRCMEGYVEMMVTESKLLKHANEVYTIGAYMLFEEQFMKFLEDYQGLVVCDKGEHVYEAIPDKYILKRWTKDIDLSLGSNSVGDVGKVRKRILLVIMLGGEKYNEVGSSNIKDLIGRRAKGERNIRKKSIVEIKCNQARAERKNALTHASRIKIVVQLSMNNEVLGRDLNFASSECQISLGTSNYGNVEPLNSLQQFINFM
ncbi:hypothetical protein M9H77_30354 [Catharanthus roseus]|uniref:Uncharacterized protein n=1 Tax=Catharanthus roseus TaxID=4058 RepID=A0ACB9ZYB4_CATRO|nr:hypothetical protein M9H77_30354 [Catharanthus roseus]